MKSIWPKLPLSSFELLQTLPEVLNEGEAVSRAEDVIIHQNQSMEDVANGLTLKFYKKVEKNQQHTTNNKLTNKLYKQLFILL